MTIPGAGLAALGGDATQRARVEVLDLADFVVALHLITFTYTARFDIIPG